MAHKSLVLEEVVNYMEYNKDSDKNESKGFSDFEIQQSKKTY